jgi:fatty-acyl-CoA synthase
MIGDLPDLLASRANLSGDAVAVEEVSSGRCTTYAELDRRATAVAALLAARGIGTADRVAILCRNRLAFFELLFGCARLGAVLVPLNWRMPPVELDQLIADAEPALLFHDQEGAQAVAGLARSPPAINLDCGYEEALAAAPAFVPRFCWPTSETWFLIYTSGTTGRPKGVIYTYGMAVANHLNISSAIGLASGDATPVFLPNFHTAGINLHALPALFAGGRLLLMEGFDAERLAELFAAPRVDLFFGVPTVYQALLEQPRFAGAPLERVRHWACGGAPLPDRLALRYRDKGVRICNGMGMTETGPTALLMDPAGAWERIGSVGKPQLLCRTRIVDEQGCDVAAGEVGELLFAGPGVTPGYWRNAEATRAAFTPDGWLRSGDLARKDADGFHYVAGRRKEMFISGGENVYPAEVEKVLAGHPAVLDAAVLGMPDPRWGEVGRAFVQLAPGAGATCCRELTAFCRERLAAYKVPASFRIVEDFPRTSAGKIQKHLLS